MARPWRSDERAISISWMISGSVEASDSDRAGQRIAAQGAEADPLHAGRLAGLQRHPVIVDHDQHAVAVDHGPVRGEVQIDGTGMFSRWMYCQTSSSVQFDSGNTRMLSPSATLPL
jgi:hypothetical protein